MAKRNLYVWSVRLLMWFAVGITAALTAYIVGYVLIQGIPNLSWEFLSTKPSYLADTIGILPDILNTVYIVIATLVVVIPLGKGSFQRSASSVLCEIHHINCAPTFRILLGYFSF